MKDIKNTYKDYKFYKTLGEGAFAKVKCKKKE